MSGRLLRLLLPALAVAGFVYAVAYTTLLSQPEPSQPAPLALPAESEYPSAVSGSGLVEANTRNIAVGSFVSGIVASVAVTEGERVAAGAPLFMLDARLAEAELAIARQDAAAADATVREAEAELADLADQLRRVERLRAGVSISEDRQARVQYAHRTAIATLGAARAQAEAAHARVQAAQVTLDRLVIRAPVAGRVLKVSVRPGEFVAAGETLDPPLIMGDDSPLHVRVQIDENDLWRLRTDAPAEAMVRGNRAIRFPLSFVRVEPYVLPKRSLTGDRAERVDTRVLELIYSFQPDDQPVYIGQQVDVFIDAKPNPPARDEARG